MVTYVKEFLLSRKADFVGLQETMKKNYTDKFFRQIDPGREFEWHWIRSVGKSSGVLCGVRMERFEVKKVVVGEYTLVAHVYDKKIKKELTIATVYGPTHEDKKEAFITELSQLCSSQNQPLLIGGDFNIMRFSDDKNKSFLGNKFTDLFNWVINTHGMRDVDLNGGKYTWSNNQVDPTLERLDRVLMSDKWEKEFPLTNLRKAPREMSDHNPLMLGTDWGVKNESRPFCFETAWIRHHEFLPKVRTIWEEQVTARNAVEVWNIKVKRVKKFLKGWGMSLKGHTRKYRRIL